LRGGCTPSRWRTPLKEIPLVPLGLCTKCHSEEQYDEGISNKEGYCTNKPHHYETLRYAQGDRKE
jgi:hypothetical protein